MTRNEALKAIEQEQKKLNDSIRVLEFVLKSRQTLEESKKLLMRRFSNEKN